VIFVDVLLSVQKTNAIGFPIDRIAIKALILVSYYHSFKFYFRLIQCNIILLCSIAYNRY